MTHLLTVEALRLRFATTTRILLAPVCSILFAPKLTPALILLASKWLLTSELTTFLLLANERYLTTVLFFLATSHCYLDLRWCLFTVLGLTLPKWRLPTVLLATVWRSVLCLVFSKLKLLLSLKRACASPMPCLAALEALITTLLFLRLIVAKVGQFRLRHTRRLSVGHLYLVFIRRLGHLFYGFISTAGLCILDKCVWALVYDTYDLAKSHKDLG
jgi:hypothetical protein